MSALKKYTHWHLKLDETKILWLGLSRANVEVNSINVQVLHELKEILEDTYNKELQGLIIYSKKKKGFIAGADIHEFSSFDEKEAEEFIQLGQRTFDKLAILPIPTVAMIQGFCLGGGAELALACRYRIITDEEKSCVGFPEVLIGIIPAWGGLTRLPNLIGGFKSLTRLLLSGKSVYAKEALQLGLVDAVVPLRLLRTAAVDYILYKPVIHKLKLWKKWLNQGWRPKILAEFIRRSLIRRVNPNHYPAPYAMLDLWKNKHYLGVNIDNEIVNKIKILMRGNTARQLIRLFFLKERLKNQAKTTVSSIKHVHVVGAGVMGGEIAAWCALHGLKVTFFDPNIFALGGAFSRAVAYFKKQTHSIYAFQAASDRLIPDVEGQGLRQADIIIEAIVENLEAKQTFFKDAENLAKPTAILATNTSSLSVKKIAEVLKKPERLIGIHFFNPVSRMNLVEVVKNSVAKETKKGKFEELLSQTLAFVVQIGKLPILVEDSPGFLVNRILIPYLKEALTLVEEGVDAEIIDKAATSFGMMMGPIELADTIGLDICLAVTENLADIKILSKLRKKVADGKLGKKTGEGFFKYNKRGRKRMRWLLQKNSDVDDKKITTRLMSQMIHEAELCLQEGIVDDADLVDAAMVLGTGFAPFRGGPMQCRNLINNFVDNSEKYNDK